LTGLSSACVQIQSGDEAQHRALMRPQDADLCLADAVELASQLVGAGVEVECSVVVWPEVDLTAAEATALALGASFKARPYFP
jgi:electron transfer flavoprotein alpha/beta subunit